MTARPVLALAGLVLAGMTTGCAISEPPVQPPDQTFRTSPAATPSGETRAGGSGSVLYARDGSPIAATGPGGPSTVGNPGGGALGAHQPGDETGGRMYILELYQRVIEERDTLAHELSALNAELDHTRKTLTAADRRIAELESSVTAVEADKRALIDQNLDLAGRLTTAQIRRLQAEKILLQKNLAELREDGEGTRANVEQAPVTETQKP